MAYFLQLRTLVFLFLTFMSVQNCIFTEAMGLCKFEEMFSSRRNVACSNCGTLTEAEKDMPDTMSGTTEGVESETLYSGPPQVGYGSGTNESNAKGHSTSEPFTSVLTLKNNNTATSLQPIENHQTSIPGDYSQISGNNEIKHSTDWKTTIMDKSIITEITQINIQKTTSPDGYVQRSPFATTKSHTIPNDRVTDYKSLSTQATTMRPRTSSTKTFATTKDTTVNGHGITSVQTTSEALMSILNTTISSMYTAEYNDVTEGTYTTEHDKNTDVTHTTDRHASTVGIITTKKDHPTTETHTTKQQSTSGEIHTTVNLHTTKETTTAKKTEMLSTKEFTSASTTLATISTTSSSPSCPTNMVYMNCTCQTTCEDPNRLNGCYNNCAGSETCICPDGFYLTGEDCVPPEECSCYVENEILILPEGDTQNFDACTRQCSCNSGILQCSDFQCNTDATCENRNHSLQCYCNDGYHGDGVMCTRLTDCQDVYDVGLTTEDVYYVLPTDWPGPAFQVYCKDGWTVFQRRQDGSEDFYRNWNDYKEGFGDLRTEMWLGLEKLHFLTKQGFYKLKISLLSDGLPYEIDHIFFKIGNEGTDYTITDLGSYSSNLDFDYFDYHRGRKFTTKDRDNDGHNDINCAVDNYGAWWYHRCYNVNFNGRYGYPELTGVCLFKRGFDTFYCNIPFTEMSIKPV